MSLESLQSHCIHTQFHWSSGSPVCFPSWGTQVQIPRGVIMWNQDSPDSVVSLHWWPWRDWSLWPRLRRASSRTATRPSCQQCDNPTWSHTDLLFRFHVHCRSSCWLHNWNSWLQGGSPVEGLRSHCIHTQFHWSSGSTICFRYERPGFNSPAGYLCETGILLLALTRYILDFLKFTQILAWILHLKSFV